MSEATGRRQRVVLLGGTSEIGLALIRALKPQGATIILAGRDDERLKTAAATLPSYLAVERTRFDAAEPATHAALFDRLFAADVDLVIAAFGVLPQQREAEQDPMCAVEALTVNLSGQASVLLHAARRMRDQGQGALVVFSSVAAVRGRRANFVYGAAKAGLDAFACGLADALHGSGVHLLLVRSGFVHGRMTRGMKPAPFATTPEKVAAAAAAGLRRRRSVVWVPRVLAALALVMRCTPRAVWRRLPF